MCYVGQKPGKYPVMFYIFGGAFIIGDTLFYVPTHLMETEDVIVVTTQYRVGSLGE